MTNKIEKVHRPKKLTALDKSVENWNEAKDAVLGRINAISSKMMEHYSAPKIPAKKLKK